MVPILPHTVAFAVSFKGFCLKWRPLQWLQQEIFRSLPRVSSSGQGILGETESGLIHSYAANTFSCISYPLN